MSENTEKVIVEENNEESESPQFLEGNLTQKLEMARELGDKKLIAEELTKVAQLLLESSDVFEESLQNIQEALETVNEIHPDNKNQDVLNCMKIKGSILLKMKKDQEALDVWREALQIARDIHGGDTHIQVADFMSNMADTSAKLGKNEEALNLYQQTLVIQREVLGGDNEKVANSMLNIGMLLGRTEAAVEMLKGAKKVYEEIHGTIHHPDVGSCVVHIADIFVQVRDFENAGFYFQEGLGIFEDLPNPTSASNRMLVYCIYMLGIISHDTKRWSQGARFLKEGIARNGALPEEDRFFDEFHKARNLCKLAICFNETGKRQDAFESLLQANELFGDYVGEESYSCHFLLAGAYRGMGKYEAAEELYRQCSEMMANIQGSTYHETRVFSLIELSQVLGTLGKTVEKLEVLREIVEMCHHNAPDMKDSLAYAEEDIALTMDDNDYPIEETLQAQLNAIESATVWDGDKSAEIIASTAQIAGELQVKLEKPKEALELFQKSFQAHQVIDPEMKFKSHHTVVNQILDQMEKLEMFEEAFGHCETVLTFAEKNIQVVAMLSNRMGLLDLKVNKLENAVECFQTSFKLYDKFYQSRARQTTLDVLKNLVKAAELLNDGQRIEKYGNLANKMENTLHSEKELLPALKEAQKRGADLSKRGEFEEALGELEKTADLSEQIYGKDSLEYAIALTNNAIGLSNMESFEEMLVVAQQSVDVARACGRPGIVALQFVLNQRKVIFTRLGRFEEAYVVTLDIIEVTKESLSLKSNKLSDVLLDACWLCIQLGNPDQAIVHCKENLEQLNAAPKNDPERTKNLMLTHKELSLVMFEKKNYHGWVENLEEAVEIAEVGGYPKDHVMYTRDLAEAYSRLKAFDTAFEIAYRLVGEAEMVFGEQSEMTAHCLVCLGNAELGCKKFTGASANFKRAMDLAVQLEMDQDLKDFIKQCQSKIPFTNQPRRKVVRGKKLKRNKKKQEENGEMEKGESSSKNKSAV